jgi:hypothetical protein
MAYSVAVDRWDDLYPQRWMSLRRSSNPLEGNLERLRCGGMLGGIRLANPLRESERLTCGGANTAVDRLGKDETWLAVRNTGAKLPPASQELTFRSWASSAAFNQPESCRGTGPGDQRVAKDENCGQPCTRVCNSIIFSR